MKEKLFGLKKEPINRMFQKMESDYLHEKVQIEYELKILMEENNKLRARLKEVPNKNSIVYEDATLWNLGKERISGITDYLQQQKDVEIESMKKQSIQRIQEIQRQIDEVELEIQSAEQSFKKMFHQLANLVEQSEHQSVNEHFTLPVKEQRGVTNQKSTSFSVIADSYSIENQNERQNSINNSTQKTVEAYDQPTVSGQAVEKSESGEASLLEQIDSIKSQYIVGKVAGEDLMDSKGRLIISKSQVITSQAVNAAHREGKLAELIVNMKISGLGED